jgi:tetratricopeptide (TPR) repeat protein
LYHVGVTRRVAAQAALLIVLVVFVYWPTLDHGFVWDDDGYVQNNLTLRRPEGLRDIWLDLGATPQYYPLVHTSFWVEYQLWGLEPRGYHAVNLSLHAAAAVLVWRLLSRLAVPGAWLAAAVFALHPVHVETVAWVTERKNVLSMVFALASLLVYLRCAPPEAPAGVRPSPTSRYLAALALYGAALLSKTVTASVPAVLLVVFWWKRGRITRPDVAWLAPFFALGLALSGVTVWMERTHVGAQGPEWQLSLVERVLVAGRAAAFYAGKLLWPDPLVFFYPRWTVDASAAWQFLYPAAVVALAAALWLARGRIGRGPLAALLVFVGVLTPALGFFDVFPFRYSFVADHFQYHASVGWIAGVVGVATLGVRRLGRRARAGALVGAVAVLAALGAKARQQVQHYRDAPTLYASVIAANPESWAAHNNLGRHLQNQGRYEEAIVHYREAVLLRPELSRIRNNRGSSLSSLGRLDEAEAELGRAFDGVAERTDQADTHVYLAVVLIQKGRFAEAAQQLRTALDLRPRDAWALYNLGVALGGSGDLEAGVATVRESLALQPGFAMGHRELGSMFLALGDVASAVPAFEEAVRLEPGNAAYRTDLGTALRIRDELRRKRDGSNPPPAR